MKISSLHILVALLAVPALSPAHESIAQAEYSFSIARVKYAGGGDWYSDPQSLTQLLEFVRGNTLMSVAPREDVVELTSDKLFTYPYLYMTGHGNIRFTDREAERLRRYLLGGGFLHVDDNYGLDKHFRREIKKVFPDRELVELPFDHPIYHTHFNFPNGLPKIHEHDGKAAQGLALLSATGRVLVFYSYESDLGDGWEPEDVHGNDAATRLTALQMGTNILAYAMTQ